MKFIELTLPTPEQNLACDEVLLDVCEKRCEIEILRFWESPQPFVVLGYSNRIATEVNRDMCHRLKIPILRRCSGGGTVVQGPGCLSYSLILKIPSAGPLASIIHTNSHIMNIHRQALQSVVAGKVTVQGHTDLALGPLKFSGNAQRRKQKYLLFHGTLLFNYDLAFIEQLLPMPSREPTYRCARPHQRFLTNLNLSPVAVREALKKCWNADDTLLDVPLEDIETLAVNRYATDEWTNRL